MRGVVQRLASGSNVLLYVIYTYNIYIYAIYTNYSSDDASILATLIYISFMQTLYSTFKVTHRSNHTNTEKKKKASGSRWLQHSWDWEETGAYFSTFILKLCPFWLQKGLEMSKTYSWLRFGEAVFKNRSYFLSILLLLYFQHSKKILAQNTKKEKPLETASSCKISIPIFTGPEGPDKLWMCIKAPGWLSKPSTSSEPFEVCPSLVITSNSIPFIRWIIVSVFRKLFCSVTLDFPQRDM